MNKLGKKGLTFAVTTIMATATVFAASADYMSGIGLGHKADEWEYGNQWGLNGNYQYSYFYCKNERHTATAIIRRAGGPGVGKIDDTVRIEGKKGKWAKAKTKRHNSYDEWHSHYNHPDMK